MKYELEMVRELLRRIEHANKIIKEYGESYDKYFYLKSIENDGWELDGADYISTRNVETLEDFLDYAIIKINDYIDFIIYEYVKSKASIVLNKFDKDISWFVGTYEDENMIIENFDDDLL